MSAGVPSNSGHAHHRECISRQPRQIRQRIGRLHWSMVNEMFVDLHRFPARAIYVAGWQRSGSTWLAEILASMPGTRLVYEPANVRLRLFSYGQPRLVPLPLSGPGSQLGKDGIMLSKALDGSLRSPWMDRMNPARWTTRRVVKDVRTIAVLPWIADKFYEVPIVLLLRHPVAVAHSIIELGWVGSPEYEAARDHQKAGTGTDAARMLIDHAGRLRKITDHDERQRKLIDEVSLWSAQYGWAMSHPASARIHAIFYEDLVEQPHAELERLEGYLAGFDHVWSAWHPQLDSLRQPSATSFRRRSGTPSQWIDSWSGAYDSGTLKRVQQIIDAQSLGGLYGASPRPLVGGESAIDTVR